MEQDKLIGYTGELKDKIDIYYFDKGRNKCIVGGCSASSMKKKLLNIKGKKCYLCNHEFDNSYRLELEHIIPVEIGGKIFCLSNLDLVCVKCHRKKTLIDKRVIRIIKYCGFIPYVGNSFVKLEELRKIYLYWFNIVKLNKDRYDKWYYGNSEFDYNQLNDLSNREVEDGKSS